MWIAGMYVIWILIRNTIDASKCLLLGNFKWDWTFERNSEANSFRSTFHQFYVHHSVSNEWMSWFALTASIILFLLNIIKFIISSILLAMHVTNDTSQLLLRMEIIQIAAKWRLTFGKTRWKQKFYRHCQNCMVSDWNWNVENAQKCLQLLSN